MVWPDTTSEWTYVDRVPDAASEEKASRVFRKLLELDAANPARFLFAPESRSFSLNGSTTSKGRSEVTNSTRLLPGRVPERVEWSGSAGSREAGGRSSSRLRMGPELIRRVGVFRRSPVQSV